MKLEKEFNYYLENQDDLVSKYNGKYLVIKNCKIIGVFDSEPEAFLDAQAKHPLGSFLVQKCEPGTESYSQTFHSRVVFT